MKKKSCHPSHRSYLYPCKENSFNISIADRLNHCDRAVMGIFESLTRILKPLSPLFQNDREGFFKVVQ